MTSYRDDYCDSRNNQGIYRWHNGQGRSPSQVSILALGPSFPQATDAEVTAPLKGHGNA